MAGFDGPVGNWLQVTVLCELMRWNWVFSCSTGPRRGFKEAPQRPANASSRSPYFSDFSNLMPRPFVCRKHAPGRGNELTEAHFEVPELGLPWSSGLTVVCRVASNSPPWDRQVEISFPSPVSCENIIKHPWHSLPLLTRGEKKNTYKPQSLITHYKHETLRAIAQGGETPQCSSPAGWVAAPRRRQARSCCSTQAAVQRPARSCRRGGFCRAHRCAGSGGGQCPRPGCSLPAVPPPSPAGCSSPASARARVWLSGQWVIPYGVRWGFGEVFFFFKRLINVNFQSCRWIPWHPHRQSFI